MLKITAAALASSLALALAACSPGPEASSDASAGTTAEPAAAPDGDATPPAGAQPAAAQTPPNTLALEGLDELRIGEVVPAGGSWYERGAQENASCRTVSSPAYPGVYAIVLDGKVQRITVGQRSDVKLIEGVGVGSSEADVQKWFAGFREEPHKYEDKPAKYLTAPNAGSGAPALRFEIDGEDKVKLIHVGTMPALGYVEGCS